MPTRISSSRLVGRDEQVARLAESARSVASEARPHVVLVGGEAGVGKTRLVSELAARADNAHAELYLGHCIEISQGDLPFAPIVEALRRALQDLTPDDRDKVLGSSRAELAGLLPELGGDGAIRNFEGGRAFGQGRMFELLLGVLERLGGTPAILVVEDLHWADASTRDFLGFIARSTRTACILVIATYRTDELHRRHPLRPFLGEIERLPTVEVIDLPRLTRQNVTDQVQEILGELPPFDLVERLFELSEGNPFFVEELLAATERGDGGLPQNIRDALLFRLEGVSDQTQRILRVASVAGREVPHTLLEKVSEMEGPALDEGLREAVGSHLLIAHQARETYAFRHALMREAVYADLLPGERKRIHLAFANTLDGSPDLAQSSSTAAAELAYHYHEAHEYPKALKSSVGAGRAAMSAYAFAEARTHFERAIDLWSDVPDAEVLAGTNYVDLLRTTAEASLGQGDPERAIAWGNAAIEEVDAEADPVSAGLMYERMGRYLWVVGKTQESYDAHEKAVDLLRSHPPSPEHARVLAGQAQILMLSARFSESNEVVDRAIAMAREVGAREVLGHALNTGGVNRAYTESPEEGIAQLRESIAIAKELNEYDDIGRGYTNLCELMMISGRAEEAMAEYKIAIQVDEQIGIGRSYGVWHRADLANALLPFGRWDEAQKVLDEVGFLPFDQVAGNLSVARARLATLRGDLDDAVEPIRIAERQLAFALQPQTVGPLRIAEAELELWRGHPERASKAARAGLAVMAEERAYPAALAWFGLRAQADLAGAARAQRDETREREALEAAADFKAIIDGSEEHVLFYGPPSGPYARGCLAMSEPEMARARGEANPDGWSAAADGWESLGVPFERAYCKWREAEAALVSGARGRAAAALSDAYATAKQLGARALLEETVSLATRGRITLDEEDSAAGDGAAEPIELRGLTAREREVLTLLADGLTNSQIAESLFISRKTVSVHVSHILEKFGVSSRVEAAGIAHRLGLAHSGRATSAESV